MSTESRDSIVDVLDLSFYSETIPGIREPWSIQGGGEQIPPEEKTPLSKDLIRWLRIYCSKKLKIPLENWVLLLMCVDVAMEKHLPSSLTQPPPSFLLTCRNMHLAI